MLSDCDGDGGGCQEQLVDVQSSKARLVGPNLHADVILRLLNGPNDALMSGSLMRNEDVYRWRCKRPVGAGFD